MRINSDLCLDILLASVVVANRYSKTFTYSLHCQILHITNTGKAWEKHANGSQVHTGKCKVSLRRSFHAVRSLERRTARLPVSLFICMCVCACMWCWHQIPSPHKLTTTNALAIYNSNWNIKYPFVWERICVITYLVWLVTLFSQRQWTPFKSCAACDPNAPV